MSLTSNIDSVGQFIENLIASFGFTSPSTAGGTVGDRAAKTIAEGIHERAEQGQGPDGASDRNAPSTIKKKGFDKPNFDTGEMLSAEQIAGDVDSSDDTCTIRYGQDPENRRKAGYAHTGQSRLKVVRRFMALDPTINSKVHRGAAEDLKHHIEGNTHG